MIGTNRLAAISSMEAAWATPTISTVRNSVNTLAGILRVSVQGALDSASIGTKGWVRAQLIFQV